MLAQKYRLHRLLGDGSAGEVWEAENTLVGRRVAVKILHRELALHPDIRARFMAEARAAGRIMHPNVAGVFDLGDEDGTPFMVMELCDGEMLSTITEERGAVGAAYAAELVSQVTKALQAAHALGIVHRDLKPANIMVVHPRPDQPVVKVLDFGIAVSVHTQGLSPGDRGRVFGTPAYMAPEQAVGGPIDHRADLYAVGAILYELLSGRAPFGGESAEEVLEQVRRRPPKPLKSLVRDVPPELELLVRRSLAKDPAKRPGSAREMERVLAPFAHALHQPVPHVDHDSAPPLPLVSRTSLSEDETKSSQRARLQLVSESSIPPPPDDDQAGSL
jgi:serine/threonine-protein kinase